MRKLWRVHGTISFAILIAVLPLAAGAQTAKLPVHIAAKPIADALIDLALQTQLSVGHSGIDFQDRRAKPVDGLYSPEDALRQLLAGSGLGYDFLDEHTVRILVLAAPPPVAPSAPPLQEIIVVTATKRVEVAQTLPYSISVITGGQLEDLGAESASDLASHVPGLSATNLGSGENKLFIRGLSDSIFSGRSQSVVGSYLDDARVSDNAPDPGLKLIDIDRVEILRGPQGTLYGAGALAGLVRVITNKPVLDEWQSSASSFVATTEDGAPSAGVSGMFNIPLVADSVAMRTVAYVERDGGYIDDVRLHLNDINHSQTAGMRTALDWRPDAAWSIAGGLIYQDIETADSQYAFEGLAPYQRANFLREPYGDKFFQGNIGINANLAFGTLTSETALTIRNIRNQSDATLAWNALTGFPEGPTRFNNARDIRSVTHETRFSSSGDGDWKWLAGIFASYRDEDYGAHLTGPDANGAPTSIPTEIREDHAAELAAFGEATYRLNEHWSVIGGARAFYSALDVSADLTDINARTQAHVQGSNARPDSTYKFVVDYQPNGAGKDAMTLYALASDGFRLGGVNINGPSGAIHNIGDDELSTTTFNSDRLYNFEVGAKTSFFDGRLIADSAAYFDVWNNVQSDQILPDGSLFIANVGTARIAGTEWEIAAQPAENLRLNGNVSWNASQILHPNSLVIQSEGLLPAVPQIEGDFSARYDVPVFDDMDAFGIFDINYVGKSRLGFNEDGPPSMGDYTLSNIRVGLIRGPWQATLFVNNVTNDNSNTYAFGNSFDLGRVGQRVPPRPRTVGFSLNWSH